MENEKSLETNGYEFIAKQDLISSKSSAKNSTKNLLSRDDETTKSNFLEELDKKHKINKNIKDYKNLKELVKSVLERLSDTVEKTFEFIKPGLQKKNHEEYEKVIIRDLRYILYSIVYALIESDVEHLNKLPERSLLKDVSESSIKLAIQEMKKTILNPFLSELNSRKELEISDIQKLYPKQWMVIKTTQYVNGFPFQGKILFYDSNISNLINKINQMTGNIYVFFTSSIDEKAESMEVQHSINSYLAVIESHFERIENSLTKSSTFKGVY